MRTLRRLKVLLAGTAGALALSACDFDVYELPLPGGTDTGDDPITVQVMFVDVLDLVPKSTVKVNDVSVGQVTAIALDGAVAEVTLELRNDTELPADAVAEIRQTSLLGEKFVQLAAPEQSTSSAVLESGATIPLERSGRNPEVEEVLGALSLLLNGGGIAKLKTIAQELNLALEGREDSARSVLTQIESFTGQLDEGKGDIVDAIESLNQLAINVRRQQGTIDLALEELPSALRSIDTQRDDLVRMLRALNNLSDVGVRVINASKASTIESFRLLQPVLTELANSGDAFVDAFNVFLTYPFVDEVVGRDPQVARTLQMGDFTNLSIEMNLDLGDLTVPGLPVDPADECVELRELDQIPIPLPTEFLESLCEEAAEQVTACVESVLEEDIDLEACLGLLDNLPGEIIDELCTVTPDLPICGPEGGPSLPVPVPTVTLPVPGAGGGDGPGLPELPGLPRPGFGPTTTEGGPTMGELMKMYEPALVSLLVPGMVIR